MKNMSKMGQKFNVVCVTKWNGNKAYYHQAVTGEAVVKHILETRSDISISRTVVTFNRKDYDLSHVRNGLSGSALVIGIHNTDEKPYDTWELYTDTPSAKPDRPGEIMTSEKLRERAKRAIQQATHW